MKRTEFHSPPLFSLILLASLFFVQTAFAQGRISGTVIDDDTEEPLIGATILVQGSSTGTVTDIDGNFTIDANEGDLLQVSFTGYNPQTVPVGTQTNLQIRLVSGIAIDEIVVTGYSTQRKKDITGAVSVVDVEEMNQIAASSFTQKLEGRAPGVTISTSGEPGEGTTVRIRGISSFQNNDPLYIIDGVPVQDAYNTGFNPNDIESIQVLKDAASASIYGARANNGVIIITTKKGQEGKTRITYDAYVGVATPAHNMDYMITDPLEYSEYVWDRYENAGLTIDAANPYSVGRGRLPDYIYPFTPGTPVDESAYSYPDNIIMRANKAGTHWFDETFDPALMTEHNIGVSGGTANNSYYLSTSYLDQNGTMLYNYFKRFSLRANSSFKLGPVTVGENLSLTRSTRVGQDGFSGGNQDEQGIMTFLTLINPLIPVHDISGTHAGGAKASGLGNGGNAVYANIRNKDNQNISYRVLGNAYAEWEILNGLRAKTSFGINYFNNFSRNFSYPSYENQQPNTNNGFSENWQNGYQWTWTNTLAYSNVFAEKHNFQVLVGYEAIKNNFRQISGGLNNYVTLDINAWYLNGALADPDTRSVGSSGGFNSLVSAFAKLDYSFDDKYILSGTLRRDGSSNFGDEKFGIFPAFSVGWRIGAEPFLQRLTWLDDLKIRAGWGVTGNQSIPSGNPYDRFGGGLQQTFYDIGGTNNSLVTGYALVNRGNSGTKWEENVSKNIGLDASILNGSLNLVLDVYSRTVDGLLFPAALPGTAGTAAPAYINVASMRNNGVDIGLDWNRRTSTNFSYNVGLTFTSYVNEVLDIDGSSETFFPGGFDSRIGIVNFNMVGQPISTFYGWTADGYFQNQQEVDAHAEQQGKAIGRIRFRDISGPDGVPDGMINDDDKGPIGNPHPDFTLGFNLGFNIGQFDFTAFVFASIGNEIFNYQKLFDVFSFFNSNVRRDVVTDSWTPSNPNAKYPINDLNDIFSISPSTFYVEDASYLRAKNIQLGYTFPAGSLGKAFSKLRIYVTGQNLFTFTNYSGLDPSPSNFGQSGLNGDLWNGYDFGNYPTTRTIMFGVNAGF
ncbi:MAG: TonB-dependent receptor [Saprospiraceae bacterium]|nr:TonB-dependent receptor [Lewinella sp.]